MWWWEGLRFVAVALFCLSLWRGVLGSHVRVRSGLFDCCVLFWRDIGGLKCVFSNCFIGFFERTRLLLAVAVSIGATEGTLLSGTSVVAFVLGWYLAGGRLTTVLPSWFTQRVSIASEAFCFGVRSTNRGQSSTPNTLTIFYCFI